MLTQDQLQQSVDSLGKEIMRHINENRKLGEFTHRFKRSDENNYLKIKEVAKEHITNFLTQAEPDKRRLLGIALNSIVLALNKSPYRYDIIFSNSGNNNNNNEYQESLLVLANSFFNSLLEKLVNKTMYTLESEAQRVATEGTDTTDTKEPKTDTESNAGSAKGNNYGGAKPDEEAK
jgi:hypothetical protein